MANPQIYVLDGFKSPDGQSAVCNFVMWLVAPAARVVPNPNAKSIVPGLSAIVNIGGTGVSGATMLAAIQAGTIVEQFAQSGQVTLFQADGQTPLAASALATSFESIAQSQYTAAQAALTASALAFHAPGAVWNGTTWTAGP